VALRDADEVTEFYNRLYVGWYSEYSGGGGEIDFIESWEPGSLLDVGCGKGSLLKYAHARGHRVSGLDLSPVALEMAAWEVPSAELELGVAEEMPFGDETFDYVTCLGSLEHFAEPPLAVREMSRVLKPGGKAVVAVPNSHHLEAVVNSLRYGISGHDGQILEELGTYNQWREMLEENGLQVVGVDKYNKRPPLMFLGYGVYTIAKGSPTDHPEGVAKQLFEMGEGKDLKGMMALVDPAKAGLLQPQFEYRFINNKFGQGFTRVLVYTPVEDGTTATVTLTVPSHYIQGKLAGSTVKVADIRLIKVGGKWMVSDVFFGLY